MLQNHDNSHDSLTLMMQPATLDLIENLYQQGFIKQQGKCVALALICPHPQWGHWLSFIVSALGYFMVALGMGFFFLHQWPSMSPFYKLISVEAISICCVMGAWVYSPSNMLGKLFLLFSCLLIGVFINFFDKFTTTGIPFYGLSLIWLLLILPWIFLILYPNPTKDDA